MKIRYIMAYCAAIVGLASCGNENGTVAPGKSMQAKVSVVNEQLTSRAAWNESMTDFAWAEGDNVAFYAPDGAASTLEYSQEQTAFTGMMTTSTEDGTWYAAFPAASAIEDPNYDLRKQSGTLADFSNNYDIMLGECQDIKAGEVPSEISMQHKMALLVITNNLTNAFQLVGRTSEGKVITGLRLKDGALSVNTATYNTSGNNPYLCEISAGATCYVAVPTQTVKLQDNKADAMAAVINKNPLSLEPGKKYTLAINAKAQSSTLLPGEFSVSATKKVQFTKGNLYWDGSAFKFEANQTDFPTSWDVNHVGHFYWSKTVSVACVPIYDNASESASDKLFCGEDNKITVEGTEGFYALSSDEWLYLIKTRANASNLRKYGVSVTNNSTTYTNCLIIAPDGFAGTLQSSYTLADINSLGLVCLPAVGCRQGSYDGGSVLCNAGDCGYYWSSTPAESDWALNLFFESDGIYASGSNTRDIGHSLRLVK